MSRSWAVDLLLLLTVFSGALVPRAWHLQSWPVFIDEDEYATTTAAVSAVDLTHSFKVAARVGDKPVLFYWLTGAMSRMCGGPLLAGRWISAVSGAVTACCCFVLGRKYGGRGAGLLAGVIAAISPWAILQDRQNIHDPLMTALVMLTTILICVTRQPAGTIRAVATAFTGALAVFAKPQAVLLVAVPWLISITRQRRIQPAVTVRNPASSPPEPPMPTYAAAVCSAGPLLMYLMLRFGHLGAPSDRLALLADFGPNLADFFDACLIYAGWPFLILLLAGALVLTAQKRPGVLFLFMLMISWCGFWIAMTNFAPSRYYLPGIACAAVLTGLIISRLTAAAFAASRFAGMTVLVLLCGVLVHPARESFWLLRDFGSAPMSRLDDWQYRSGWPAGYAYRDEHQWLSDHLKPGDQVAFLIDVEHRLASGLYDPFAPGVASIGEISPTTFRKEWSSQRPLYLVIDDGRDGRQALLKSMMDRYPSAHRVVRYCNPGGSFGVSILEVDPAR